MNQREKNTAALGLSNHFDEMREYDEMKQAEYITSMERLKEESDELEGEINAKMEAQFTEEFPIGDNDAPSYRIAKHFANKFGLKRKEGQFITTYFRVSHRSAGINFIDDWTEATHAFFIDTSEESPYITTSGKAYIIEVSKAVANPTESLEGQFDGIYFDVKDAEFLGHLSAEEIEMSIEAKEDLNNIFGDNTEGVEMK